MRLLVVEDEADLVEALRMGLVRAGYAVDVVRDLAEARERLRAASYDLILLDLDLPGGDGVEACRILRGAGRGRAVPIVMVTTRDRPDDRLGGPGQGAGEGAGEGPDDYLVKPFVFPELLARVRALLRRERGGDTAILRVGSLRLDTARAESRSNGRELGLTPKEFGVLRHLMTRPGHVVSAEELLEHVWDEHTDPLTNTVRVTVGNLRRKLGADAVIETVVSKGYRLREET